MATWSEKTQDCLNNNKTLHETSLPVDRFGNAISGDWYLDVAKGKIPGCSVVFIAGVNRGVAINTQASVWPVGGLYPWTAWNGGAAKLYFASSSASDTAVTILVDGLDANFVKQTEIVTLNGTTAVATTKDFYRLNSLVNIGNKAVVADVNVRYGSAAGTVIGQLTAKSQMSRQSIYTVPAGYTAFSLYGDFSTKGTDTAEVQAYWRLYGGVFFMVYSSQVSGPYTAAPRIPGAIPEKTDIDNRVDYGTNNLTVNSNQQLLLIDNNYL